MIPHTKFQTSRIEQHQAAVGSTKGGIKVQSGRMQIFTDVEEITYQNVLDVLRDNMNDHIPNASKMNFLFNYEAGLQPLQREKTSRSEIDCYCNDNIANEIANFELSFDWGNAITLTQRGQTDSGTKEESEAICLLNECYEAEEIKKITQELGRNVVITGVGNIFVDIKTEWEEGDSYFTIASLDPRTSFVVHSSYHVDRRPMMGVTYRQDKTGNRYFTCITKYRRFEIINMAKITNGEIVEKKESWNHATRSGEINLLGVIPIIEYIRSSDRSGCFERQIPEMDCLNIMVSDFVNDIDQNTQAIWHYNDVDFPTGEDGEEKTPKANGYVRTYTPTDGKTPFIKPLAIQYDYPGMLSNILARRSLILQKCNVPQRNDNSGGSTGVATSDATGWSTAEIAASMRQNFTESSKMREIKAVLAAIKKSPYVPAGNPLLALRAMDMQPSIKRQKTYELTVKSNMMATLLSHGFNGLHVIKAANMFEDPNQVWADSKKGIELYQESTYENKDKITNAVGGIGEKKPDADRNMPDESDQIANSPNIDGIKTE